MTVNPVLLQLVKWLFGQYPLIVNSETFNLSLEIETIRLIITNQRAVAQIGLRSQPRPDKKAR
jgi:predicted thioredoxin/glutaredoxin